MTPSVTAEGASSVGLITEARMRRAITSLQQAGLLKQGLTPQDFVDFAAMKAS